MVWCGAGDVDTAPDFDLSFFCLELKIGEVEKSTVETMTFQRVKKVLLMVVSNVKEILAMQ